MIEIANLLVKKNGATICSVPELFVEPGERVAALGANGSGKTTLLRVLAGLERDYQGHCHVGAARKERVYVHQNPYLFRGTVLFNLTYGLLAHGRGRAESERLAREWAEKLGIRKLLRSRVDHLSGGERRRVALARAFALKPRLLLLDEPLAEMDEEGAARVSSSIAELKETTVLLASPTDLPGHLTTRTCRLGPIGEDA